MFAFPQEKAVEESSITGKEHSANFYRTNVI